MASIFLKRGKWWAGIDGRGVRFEDPVTIADWHIEAAGGHVMFTGEQPDKPMQILWMRASDAASVSDWLKEKFAPVDWRNGAPPGAGIPRYPDLEHQEFYELMQAYRNAPHTDQAAVIAAFEAVKEYIRLGPG